MSALREFAKYVRTTGVSAPGSPTIQNEAAPAPAPASPPPEPRSAITQQNVGTPPEVPRKPEPALVNLHISPESAKLLVGDEGLPFTVKGDFIDGSHADVTDRVKWSCTPPDGLVISRKGVATAVPEYAGDVTVTAKFTDKTGTHGVSAKITVTFGDHPELLKQGTTVDDSVIQIDLSSLAADLTSSAQFVAQALDAEQAMRDTAARAGLDLDKAGLALVHMKSGLTSDDKSNLEKAASPVTSARTTVVIAMHTMQKTTEKLQTALDTGLQGQLPAEFFDGLEKDILDIGSMVEHLWDVVVGLIGVKTLDDFLKAVAGTDEVKDTIKDTINAKINGPTVDVNDKIDQIGLTLNEFIQRFNLKALREMKDLNNDLKRDKNDFPAAMEAYGEAMAVYAHEVQKMTAKAGCPPEVSETYMAVIAAGQAFQIAVDALISSNLQDPELSEHLRRFMPLGKLIVNAPSGWLVFEKDHKQYGYQATVAQIKTIVRQLKLVKQVHEAADYVKDRAKEWRAALTR